jgi:hypothetical protein
VSLDDLAERPEGDAIAVGKAAALTPVRQDLRVVVEPAPELGHEPRLAHPWLADERHELDSLLASRTRVRPPEQIEVVLPSDERRAGNGLDVDPEAAPGLDGAPEGNRFGLALDRHRLELLVLDCLARGAVGRLTDDDAARGRGRLHPARRVDDVAGDERLPGRRTRTEADERLARVHRCPQGQVLLTATGADNHRLGGQAYAPSPPLRRRNLSSSCRWRRRRSAWRGRRSRPSVASRRRSRRLPC